MGSIKKNLITTTTTTTTKQNKTHAYFPIYSLSLIFKVTARAACLLTYLVLTLVLFTERYASVNSSCAQPPPPPPPGLLRGISPSFQSRGGAFANFALLGGRAFDIPGAIPSSWHARRFLSAYNYTEDITRKNADWFICQGQGLVKACSQFYVRIFYGLSSQNYTTRNRELLTWINVFWLVNQISVDIFWRTSFHIYKTIHNIKLYDALLILMSIILY